jgi:hypothetical protein
MFSQEAADEAPDFTSSTGIKLITELDEPVPLFIVDTNNKLTVFGFAFLVAAHQKPPAKVIGARIKQITTR